MPIECAPTTVQGTRVPPLTKQPVPMSRAGATTPHHALQPSDKRNAEQIQANNGGVLAMGPLKRFKNAELTYQELEKVIDKLLMENPEPVKKFIRGDKHKKEMSHCHLAGMALYMCKKRANREMLDKLLWVKLNKVANKEQVQEPKLLNASKE